MTFTLKERRVAYHEAGHALAIHRSPGLRLHNVTIVPLRPVALGGATQGPARRSSKVRPKDQLLVFLAGPAAEVQYVIREAGDIDVRTGGRSDYIRAEDLIKRGIPGRGRIARATRDKVSAMMMRKASLWVVRHWGEIELIAEWLLDHHKRTLTGAQVRNLLRMARAHDKHQSKRSVLNGC